MPCVHSRVGRGPPFGPKLPNSGRVPPLPFFPTTAVYSTRHPAGLLHPASGHGVRHVSGLPWLLARRLGAGARLSHGATPYGAFPSAAGRSASPRPDPLSPLFPVSGHGSARVATFGPASFCRSLGLRVLLHREVRCELVGVAAGGLPDAPLGLVPGGFSDASSRRLSEEWRLAGPFVVRRPRGGRPWMVPLWSEDRAGALHGSRARRRPARGQVGSASGGRPDSKPRPRGALVPIASERGLAPRDRPLQPARWPPEGGCAAGAAICQDPRAPTRLGRACC
jgi:hypothetical protein